MIDLRKLSHIIALNKERSFVRAAARLGITQPALSRSLQQIEDEYGVKLFDRSRSSVVPTAACMAMLPEAERVISDARALDRSLHGISNAEAGAVTFGMGPLPANAILPQVLSKIVNERPGISAHVVIESGPDVVRRTLNDELEFCCTADVSIPPHERVDSVPIARLPLALLVRAGHPLLRGEGRVEDFPMIGGTGGGVPEIIYRPRIRCDNYAVLIPLMLETDSVWLTPAASARQEITAGKLMVVPQKVAMNQQEVRFVLTHPHGRTLSPAARYVEGLIRRFAGELL